MKLSLFFLLYLLRRTSSFPQSGSVCPIDSLYYLSSCFTYFNRRMNWAQTEVCIHDFTYNFKFSPSFSGSFRPLTYNSKNWRWNFLILIQHNVHNHTKNQDYLFYIFLPRVCVNNMAFIFSPSKTFMKPLQWLL